MSEFVDPSRAIHHSPLRAPPTIADKDHLPPTDAPTARLINRAVFYPAVFPHAGPSGAYSPEATMGYMMDGQQMMHRPPTDPAFHQGDTTRARALAGSPPAARDKGDNYVHRTKHFVIFETVYDLLN
ncbi:unnamed protein product [Chilo suppressalis]|uniref:Uncharacterized protein n=1 Tax=Chilo suppressalis TaxID=168631 RepID=A0ABN8AWP0_CHISP|nr:unnamed protein product [Chilo suppressalis]